MTGIILLERNGLVLRRCIWLYNYIQKCFGCRKLFCVLPTGLCLCMYLCLVLQLSLANCVIASTVFCMSAHICKQLTEVLYFDAQRASLAALCLEVWSAPNQLHREPEWRVPKILKLSVSIFTPTTISLPISFSVKCSYQRTYLYWAVQLFWNCGSLEIKWLHISVNFLSLNSVAVAMHLFLFCVISMCAFAHCCIETSCLLCLPNGVKLLKVMSCASFIIISDI